MANTITVLLPVVVPSGPMCWDFNSKHQTICRQFDNEGGGAYCTLFEQKLSRDDDGVYKLLDCRSLASKGGE
jgi:hypothetical protein